jgi:hypothetical protein
MDGAVKSLVPPQQDMQYEVTRKATPNAFRKCIMNFDNLWFTLFNDPDQRPRAADARHGNPKQSRGSLRWGGSAN